jgi:UDP-N-acetylmuramate--alanine ligase
MIKSKTAQLHFVGIGGIGMSGIAEVLHNQGYLVSGSDLQESETTRRLASLGLKIFEGHHRENVHGADVVVISSAVKTTNPEFIEAHNLRIPVIPRAEMLGELMRGKTGIAIAGTHGKTTTTSMLASILTTAGFDPTCVIGGKVNALGGNAKLGQSQWVVVEADESDGSFLHLPATYGAITNIDNDHLDHFKSLEHIDTAFVDFVSKIPFYGKVAVCLDDPGVRRILAQFRKPFITYGTSTEAEICISGLELKSFGARFVLTAYGLELGSFELQVPGHHNVLNATAAIALAYEIGVPVDKIKAGIKAFQGVRRRFEVRWKSPTQKLWIIDDYGHHPSEVRATLSAAKNFWKTQESNKSEPRRVVVLFQPHRYSRTKSCYSEFLTAFADADLVVFSDIYPAGEEPIEGISSLILANEMRSEAVSYGGGIEKSVEKLISKVRAGDLVICMGAGSVTRAPELLQMALAKRNDL